jgi:hypothetical protein
MKLVTIIDAQLVKYDGTVVPIIVTPGKLELRK